MLDLVNVKDAVADLRAAMEANDSKAIEEAWEKIGEAAASEAYEKLQQDFEEYQRTQDEKILERRGIHPLTSKETAWYNKIIEVMKSDYPMQVFTEIIGSDDEDEVMPSTIIEDVFRRLTTEHPLLSKVGTQNVGYLTKWILNNHTSQTASWGTITAEIVKEITSAVKVVDVKQNKLSCFVILEQGMEDLGPTWLDSYIREVMYEAMALALEVAVISGTGLSMPIGMDRDLSDTSFSTGNGWSQKEKTTITDFTPANYGQLLSAFAKDEDGKDRSFAQVGLICNMADYLTKVMPATTVLNGMGSYVNNLFPFPTDVIVSNAVETGTVLIGLMDEYLVFIGRAARNNVIQYSDDYKFLEDQRVFKIVQYADGRAYDNTSFQLVDISDLDPAYLNVKTIGSSSTEEAEVA